jgi:hypothetical protein
MELGQISSGQKRTAVSIEVTVEEVDRRIIC